MKLPLEIIKDIQIIVYLFNKKRIYMYNPYVYQILPNGYLKEWYKKDSEIQKTNYKNVTWVSTIKRFRYGVIF